MIIQGKEFEALHCLYRNWCHIVNQIEIIRIVIFNRKCMKMNELRKKLMPCS